jgi:PhoH-like ATPase
LPNQSLLNSNRKKIFVLDTSVVLYDFQAIYSFKDQNVVLPITLLEEIDHFKRGHETINFNAREFSRELDTLIGERLLNEGVELESGGCIVVKTSQKKDAHFKEYFWSESTT